VNTPQPHPLASLINWFASSDAAHGWAVNLFFVIALALVGAGLFSRSPRLLRFAVAGAAVLCMAVWVLVQDFGFFGGVGTDPNSMIPLVLLCVAGFLMVAREPALATSAEGAELVEGDGERPPWLLRPGVSSALGITAAVAAFGIVLVGAIPLASASVNSHTDAILSEGLNGEPDLINSPAAPIDLVDQNGTAVTLSSFRGRTVALTFLDPVCTTDCPVIAQEFRQADQRLGASAARSTAFVAIVANPIYRSVAIVQAFDRQENLTSLSNWYFLTGSAAELRSVWNAYGVQVQAVSAGSMVAHADTAYVIDADGRLRAEMGADPGDDSATSASLATVLDHQMRTVMR
jgi:cytochrome oxidase Cu insertion factor (SCO1/SenC/PrrC family)